MGTKLVRIIICLLFGVIVGINLAYPQEVCLPVEQRGVFEEVPYVVSWNLKSDCSTKAKNDLKKRRDAYQAELNRCSTPTPTPTPTPSPTPPPVNPDMAAALVAWESNLINRIEYHYANPYTTGTSRYNDEHYNIIYYEGGDVFKRAQLYFTNKGNSAIALKAKAISDRLVAAYGNTAWPAYRTGSQWAYARTGELFSDALLLNTAENNAYWYNDGLNDAVSGNDARGLAYYLASLARLKEKNITVTRGHQLGAVATTVNNYINTLPHSFDLFYMLGMLGNVLLDYEVTLNPYINARVQAQKIADFIKPYVQANGSVKYGVGNHAEANEVYPELNLIIAPLFSKLGDKATAEKLFIYGVNNADLVYFAKAVPQNYMYSFDLVTTY